MFPVNNLGPLTWYTGCSFERDTKNGTLKISQTAFTDKAIERFNVRSTSPSPAVCDSRLAPKGDDEEGGDWPYRQAVGCLMWLAVMTRPDIVNTVRQFARYLDNLCRRHWNAAMRILKYLKHTRTRGLT